MAVSELRLFASRNIKRNKRNAMQYVSPCNDRLNYQLLKIGLALTKTTPACVQFPSRPVIGGQKDPDRPPADQVNDMS
jgi:hypothetical protein